VLEDGVSAYIAQTLRACACGPQAVKEKTAKRPETKEGGREEEEKRLGISTGQRSGRLRSAEKRAVGRRLTSFQRRENDRTVAAVTGASFEKFRSKPAKSLNGPKGRARNRVMTEKTQID
jgi:hypothetical protein